MASADKAVPQPIVPRMAPREDLNPYRIAQLQFDMAAEFLKLDPGLRQILRTPRRTLEGKNVPVSAMRDRHSSTGSPRNWKPAGSTPMIEWAMPSIRRVRSTTWGS